MQTMPAFVFMIPVIAFFGTGKPAAVVTTMIFGGTPVVRLTVLGLRGVPESVREAAISFGANKWYLLTKVDLPLASPSIRAGINQTIMLSLAMVVVASLIGAKGLGEDVLEALQYANVGQGILAGFSILFCAMVLTASCKAVGARAAWCGWHRSDNRELRHRDTCLAGTESLLAQPSGADLAVHIIDNASKTGDADVLAQAVPSKRMGEPRHTSPQQYKCPASGRRTMRFSIISRRPMTRPSSSC